MPINYVDISLFAYWTEVVVLVETINYFMTVIIFVM